VFSTSNGASPVAPAAASGSKGSIAASHLWILSDQQVVGETSGGTKIYPSGLKLRNEGCPTTQYRPMAPVVIIDYTVAGRRPEALR